MDDSNMDIGSEPRSDPLVAAVTAMSEDGVLVAPPSVLVAAVLDQLIQEIPEHYGPNAQGSYRYWLRRRAEVLRAGAQWRPPVTTSF